MSHLGRALFYYNVQIEGLLCNDGFSPWTLEEIQTELASPQCRVFELSGEAEGFVFYRQVDSQIEILHLAVRKKSAGFGIKLLESFIKNLQKTIEGSLEIFLEVAETNSKALKCYEKFGFSRIGLRKNYYRNGDAAMTMALRVAMRNE